MAMAYARLSYPGKVRRMRRVAERALALHGITDARLTLLAHSENVVYRVDAPSGRRFALRVHRTDYHTPAELRSELAWLEALAADGFDVPAPVRGPDGDLLVFAEAVQTPARPCSLLRWMSGRRCRAHRTTRHLAALGGLLARLHAHARDWQRPAWFTRKPLGWPQLFTDTAVADVDATTACKVFSAEQMQLFEDVRGSVHASELEPHDETHGLIHADLHFANVVFAPGLHARPIDFDDCAIGPWVLDVATTLGAVSDEPSFPALRQALLEGYVSVRNLSDRELALLDRFIAGRFVLLALYVAATAVHDPKFAEGGPQWIARFFAGARRFLEAAS